ncbi:MAG: type I-MYXAN CRISPR-associated protein Cas6/Cmx6 [Chroococcidiopsidaceae cyanobacterium CP_BM_ER_R8_30]|nr:type I-MYXAN CRISPR-associated protein Cas6/Cmx6 [Chroococcidiopsidaceae cyanobacterium CP_BM_ER_R8_30]
MKATVVSAALHDVAANCEPFVELSFSIRGTLLPADHNYALFAALVHLNSDIRKHPDISILSIPGFGDKKGKILLTEQSCMRIRVPVSKISMVYRFAGKHLTLGKHEIQLGIPETYMLRPVEILRARIVTIKGYTQPEPFIEAAKRQLAYLGISGEISIPVDREGNFLRKTVKIQRFTVIGFTTEVSYLSEEDSIKLQQWGIGGKRHVGCGFFLPVKGGRYA